MKKLFAILIMLSLAFPVLAIEEHANVPENVETMEVIQPEDAAELNQEAETSDVIIPENALDSPYKAPYSKKKLAKKFLIAMLCVVGCSVFLYGILTIYNKVRDGIISSVPTPPEGEKPLDAPNDLTEAIKTFLDKTNWD